MKQTLFVLLSCLILSTTPARADDVSDNSSDVVINALVDEMQRTKSKLQTGSHPLPYFVSYSVKEIDEAEMSSVLGADADINRARTRMITPSIRLGDHKLDSSLLSTHHNYRVQEMPTDDDYAAIRRSAWLASDNAYTFAITTFEWKKAYLRRVSVPNRLTDLSEEKPVVSILPKTKLSFDEDRWRNTLKSLSAKFRDYPSLQSSKVSLVARVVTNWIVNTDGTRIRQSKPLYGVRFYAATQANDGAEIAHYDVAVATDESDLPDDNELGKVLERVASNAVAMQNAVPAEEYTGPVLFKGQAAAKFISQVLAPNFGLTEDFLGDREKWRNPLKNAIGRRILPDYIDVIDNPTMEKYGNTSLIGGYKFDDDGVPAQKITIVKDGKLKEVCRSRVPVRTGDHSNGHSMGGLGVHNILEIVSHKTVSEEEMQERMESLAKDAGLDHVLVIEKLVDSYHLSESPDLENKTYTYDTPSYSSSPDDPVIAYKLYFDGRKEYVRGFEFNYVSLRSFRDIQAVGDDAAPYLVEPVDLRARHMITPSYLVGELDLRPEKAEFTAPPTVPSPVSEEHAK